MSIIVTKEELTELLRLYYSARTTPVISLSVADGLAGNDFASIANRTFQSYWAELGTKYGFNPDKHGFNPKTGEVVS